MTPPLGLRWLAVWGALTAASAAGLAWLGSAQVIPSTLRFPLELFVQPGTTAWWFALGGPFRTGPTSPSGIAFAASANALLWLLGIGCVAGAARSIRRLTRRT